MYACVVKRLAARFRGVCHPHSLSLKHGLGGCMGHVGVSHLHTFPAKASRAWLRPTTVLAQTQQVLQQYAPVCSPVAALSSLSSASELSAAIADAPSHAALQSLAATAASIPQQNWLAQEYKVQLLSSLEQQDLPSLVKVLMFYAKLGPGHTDLFQEAVPVLYNRLGQLSPQDLLRLITAFSAAAQHSPTAYSQELYAALTEFLWEGLGQLEPCGLADVAWAYAAVEHYDDDEDFFGGLVVSAMQRLEAFCPDDLSKLVYSLAALRFSAPELNAAALQQMADQIEAWPLSCIGRLLWGLAAVQAPADPCTLDRVAGHVSVVLRNLRTSTDGQRVLASLGPKSSAAAAAAGRASSLADLGSLPGAGGSSHAAAGFGPGSSPTWQGFGMARSSSSSSGGGGSSSSATSIGSNGDGAASIWAAANSSSSNYEYQGEQNNPMESVDDQPLGPDFIKVTSYGPDGTKVTTYVKRGTADSSSSSNSSSNNGNGVSAAAGPAGARSISSSSRSSSPSSSSSSSSSSSRSSWYRSAVASSDGECPAAKWELSVPVPSDCRPVYDDAEALQAALVHLSWSFAMLGHLHSSCAKECFRALALVVPEAFSDDQLVMLWGAHMRYQQLGHVMLDPNPLLAESYSVFLKELSRAAPRTISLPTHLQPLAAANWLLRNVQLSPEYEQHHQQQQQDAQQPQEAKHQHQQQFSSWKFRDPVVLTQRGLEVSIRQALLHLGLPVSEPCITLDGIERVGLPLKHNGVSVAWQAIPPAWCARNPPYLPTFEAQMHKWALQYRGYTVLQVPFHEWASVLESGDVVVQAGYLQQMLNGLSVRIAKMSNF